jgi:sugar/nucleoside kinase (ribokinase family)
MPFSFTVVGGIALDSISIAGGESRDCLGGSAVYAGLAASVIGKVTVAGVIGRDQLIDVLLGALGDHPRIALNVAAMPGDTARFRCQYDSSLKTRTTLAFIPGVAADAQIPPGWPVASDVLFLGSGSPAFQLAVLEATRPRLSAVDTIDHWIAYERAGLEQVVRRTSAVLMSAEELLSFTGHVCIADAAAEVLQKGPRLVCVKQGEFGAQVYTNHHWLALPAYPSRAVDPTGAGDSFAGAFLSYLATLGADVEDQRALGEALVVATAVASICVEGFGAEALESVSVGEVYRRCRRLLDATRYSEDLLVTLQRLEISRQTI